MRIAIFTDTFPPTLNGVARALGLLVEHAAGAGHEVAVVTPEIAGPVRDDAGHEPGGFRSCPPTARTSPTTWTATDSGS